MQPVLMRQINDSSASDIEPDSDSTVSEDNGRVAMKSKLSTKKDSARVAMKTEVSVESNEASVGTARMAVKSHLCSKSNAAIFDSHTKSNRTTAVSNQALGIESDAADNDEISMFAIFLAFCFLKAFVICNGCFLKELAILICSAVYVSSLWCKHKTELHLASIGPDQMEVRNVS
jgi:hypothetical protein